MTEQAGMAPGSQREALGGSDLGISSPPSAAYRILAATAAGTELCLTPASRLCLYQCGSMVCVHRCVNR